VEDKAVKQMQKTATEYCTLIESDFLKEGDWLLEFERLLPALQCAVIALLPALIDKSYPMTPNFERRFELFTQLKNKLGDKDAYQMTFDASFEESLSGSLADDLTDIYCELKYGLVQLDEEMFDNEKAREHWTNGYHLHWGQHLVDAGRYIYELRVSEKI